MLTLFVMNEKRKTMRKLGYKYMHTIDSQPAHYHPGYQICYASRNQPIPLCNDRAQIKREQRASAKWRKSRGYLPLIGAFGWVKVAVTDNEQ